MPSLELLGWEKGRASEWTCGLCWPTRYCHREGIRALQHRALRHPELPQPGLRRRRLCCPPAPRAGVEAVLPPRHSYFGPSLNTDGWPGPGKPNILGHQLASRHHPTAKGGVMAHTPVANWTAADLERLSAQGWRVELWEGQLVRMSPTGDLHGRVTRRLDRALDRYITPRGLGELWPAEAGFDLTRPGEERQTVLAADIAFVRAARVPPPTEGYVPVVPDLVVETASPTQSRTDMGGKARQWLERGVPLVWVVWPARRRVDEWRPGLTTARTMDPDDTLDGQEILPGFHLPVAELFELDRSS